MFDEAASDVSRFRKLVERIPEMHNAQFGWVVQYNLIRTQLRKVSSQLTATVNIAKHHFLEVRRSPRARECASGFQGACPGARTLTSSSAGDGGGGYEPGAVGAEACSGADACLRTQVADSIDAMRLNLETIHEGR